MSKYIYMYIYKYKFIHNNTFKVKTAFTKYYALEVAGKRKIYLKI